MSEQDPQTVSLQTGDKIILATTLAGAGAGVFMMIDGREKMHDEQQVLVEQAPETQNAAKAEAIGGLVLAFASMGTLFAYSLKKFKK